MPNQIEIKKCTFCNSELLSDYCSTCGRPQSVKRINGKYILSEIGHVVNFEKGILFTVKELLIRPGSSIHDFIHTDRNRLVKPVLFVIVCSLIYTVLQQWLKFEDGYVGFSFKEVQGIEKVFLWISSHYGYSNFFMAFFIAFWLKVFFRKYRYNFFEILILLCFLMGVGMLIFAFYGVLDYLTNFKIIDKGFLIGVLYITWGIGQFFDKKKVINYFKAFLSYMLGMIFFTITAMILGAIIS